LQPFTHLNVTELKISRLSLFFLSLLTIVGFSGLGLSILAIFTEHSPFRIFWLGKPIYQQVLFGGLFGGFAVANGVILVRSPWMHQTRDFFAKMIGQLDPKIYHILFYSTCAAVGEEILFRGAIQPFIGIWWTSVLFIFLHGYFNPYNWQITLYGVFMVMISAGLGYLYELLGIYAAMFAHFIYDLVMFLFLRREKAQHPTGEDEDWPDGNSMNEWQQE